MSPLKYRGSLNIFTILGEDTMTYGQCKNRALGLIFSQQVAGETVPASYNNQADYLAKIPGLINDAETYIATTVKPISAVAMLKDLTYEDKGEYRLYSLPNDCYKMMMGGLIEPSDSAKAKYAANYTGDYTIIGENKILVPNRVRDDLLIEYYRYPALLSENPSDNTTLDNTPDVHECIPFYVAAYLVMYDNAFMYSAFYNNFETRLQRLSRPAYIMRREINDVYGGFGGCF